MCSTGKRERLPEVCGWKDEGGKVEGEKVEEWKGGRVERWPPLQTH